MPVPSSSPVRARLRSALKAAMKDRDRDAVDALRATLSAIDNAEAVPQSAAPPAADDSPIAGAAQGLGAGDVARRDLGEDDVRAIVAREAAEKRAAAGEYDRLARPGEAARLRAQADLLDSQLLDPAGP